MRVRGCLPRFRANIRVPSNLEAPFLTRRLRKRQTAAPPHGAKKLVSTHVVSYYPPEAPRIISGSIILAYPTLARLRELAEKRVWLRTRGLTITHSILCRRYREAQTANERYYQKSTL